MAHRIVEVVIGRLITDEQFRTEFLQDPEALLGTLRDRDAQLNATEIAALTNTDPTLWAEVADAVDPRLQKVSLQREAGVTKGDSCVE